MTQIKLPPTNPGRFKDWILEYLLLCRNRIVLILLNKLYSRYRHYICDVPIFVYVFFET